MGMLEMWDILLDIYLLEVRWVCLDISDFGRFIMIGIKDCYSVN